ncbi:hypothetical protein [Kocuria marina]|uniref:hypothetical protein n=1 Tax=Kocuria marina TaxID=223184 RepID=UPI000BF08C04
MTTRTSAAQPNADPVPDEVRAVINAVAPQALTEALAAWADGLTQNDIDRILDDASPDQLRTLVELVTRRHRTLVLEAAGDRLALDKALNDLAEAREHIDRLKADQPATRPQPARKEATP